MKKWPVIFGACLVMLVGGCMHSPPDEQAELRQSLAEFKSLVESGEYEAAVTLFEGFPVYVRDAPTTTEHTLLASKAYSELASNEPDKKKRDKLFARAVRAAAR